MITAGIFLAAFILLTILVLAGAFTTLDLRLTDYLQHRGSYGQDLGLGLFAYLGSIEVTLLVAFFEGCACSPSSRSPSSWWHQASRRSASSCCRSQHRPTH